MSGCTTSSDLIHRPRHRPAFFTAGLHCVRGDAGDALIELAVFIAFLGLPLLLGMSEMGLLVYDSIEISNAASAGAMFGMQSLVFAQNTGGIANAAQLEASDFGSSLNVVSTTYYVCSNSIGGTQYIGASAQALANAACSSGVIHALEFVQVSTNVAVTPPVRCPGLPKTFTLRGSAVMEVEQ